MVLCVALVVRGLLFLFQFRPKFGPIPDQLLFYRLCLAPVALPFSCRGGGLAERGKFAVPQRGAGVVLNECFKSPVPEGFPLLTSPAATARPPTHPALTDGPSFFRFFSIFFAFKKTLKKPIVKNLLFSHFFAILARPGVDF